MRHHCVLTNDKLPLVFLLGVPMKKYFILLFIFTISSISFGQSFRSGTSFTAVPIAGEVSVFCRDFNGGNRIAHFSCEDLRLNPVEYDFFIGPQSTADKVVLSCKQPNGKIVTKSSGYKTNKSTDRFNLWIISLFQKPLLDIGNNQIHFKLLKNGKTLQEGDFNVPVVMGEEQICPRGNITSNNMSDCDNSFNACRQYFSEYNYCM